MKKIIFLVILSMLLILSFVSCKDEEKNEETEKIDVEIDLDTRDYSQSMDFSYSSKDKDASYNEGQCERIVLSDSGSTITNGGAINGSNVTITKEGDYLVSGTVANAQLKIEATDTSKIRLIFNSLNLTCLDGPAVYIKMADKVFITLAKGSINTINDGSSYSIMNGDTTLDSAIFSKEDLTINGEGALNVNGNYKHGIVSKDDLVITGGTISVKSQSTGIEGKDCVKIGGGKITVNSGTDGIRSTNTEDTSRGFVSIDGGTVTVVAGTDAIQGETVVRIIGGTIDLTSGGGSQNSSSNQGSGWGQWGSSTTDSDSAKGIKAGNQVKITGGAINIDSSDDGVHSNIKVEISGGNLNITSGDDGIHGDDTLIISNGTVTINESYEGLEATNVNISGGNISLVASDDGINAAGGNDGSAMGQRPGMGSFSSSSGKILISGGYTFLNASGDGIDANGEIYVTGGTTLVSGPTNSGNGAFDYDTGATVTGGVLIALGSSGMAQGFSSAEGQGAILCTFTSQVASTQFCITDKNGNVIASFKPPKAYQCAVITCPQIKEGEEYKLYAGSSISGVDKNGFTQGGKVAGGTLLKEIEMSSLIYGTSTGMGGGMGGMKPPGRP